MTLARACADPFWTSLMNVLIHAPTSAALERARNNVLNLRKARPNAQIRLVLNGSAVGAALDGESHDADAVTWLCPNTLARTERVAREPMAVLSEAAIVLLAQWQSEGWSYVRA